MHILGVKNYYTIIIYMPKLQLLLEAINLAAIFGKTPKVIR